MCFDVHNSLHAKRLLLYDYYELYRPLDAQRINYSQLVLKNCGHKPWIERQVKEEFFRVLKEQLR